MSGLGKLAQSNGHCLWVGEGWAHDSWLSQVPVRSLPLHWQQYQCRSAMHCSSLYLIMMTWMVMIGISMTHPSNPGPVTDVCSVSESSTSSLLLPVEKARTDTCYIVLILTYLGTYHLNSQNVTWVLTREWTLTTRTARKGTWALTRETTVRAVHNRHQLSRKPALVQRVLWKLPKSFIFSSSRGTSTLNKTSHYGANWSPSAQYAHIPRYWCCYQSRACV